MISQIKTLTLQLSLAIVASLVFNWWHLPVAWLLGSISAGILYKLLQKNSQPFPSILGQWGQGIIAVTTATYFSLDTLDRVKTYLIPLFFCLIITACASLLNGYLLWRLTGIDRATSFLGCIPGMSHSLVAMSQQMGADAISVAVLQYVRVCLVSTILPPLVSFFFSPELTVNGTLIIAVNDPNLPFTFDLIIIAFCTSFGLWLADKLRLPMGFFFAPLSLGLIFSWFFPILGKFKLGELAHQIFNYSFNVPPFILAVGLLLLGLSIGLKFDWENTRKLLKAVLIEIILVIVLIVICLLIGYQFHRWANVDTLTGILGFTPGGMSAIAATVIELGGDSGLVLAMQLTRMLLILALSPWLATIFLNSVPQNESKLT